MKLIRSSICGLCYGVQRACRVAERMLEKNGPPVFTLGPLMHNPQEVARLESMGVSVRDRLEECRGAVTLVRTHGIDKGQYSLAERLGVRLLDTTCPHVKLVRRNVVRLGREGATVLLLGDRRHAEVVALESFAAGPVYIVSGPQDLPALDPATPVALLSQTTQNPELFESVAEACRRRYRSPQILCTVCQDAALRQREALRLADGVDVLLVVGGRNSANTSRLFHLCRRRLERTHHIESAADLAGVRIGQNERVGVVSGASTPEWVIAQIEESLGRRATSGSEAER